MNIEQILNYFDEQSVYDLDRTQCKKYDNEMDAILIVTIDDQKYSIEVNHWGGDTTVKKQPDIADKQIAINLISDYDYSCTCETFPEYLATFGIEPDENILEVAQPDYKGKVKIWRNPNYYPGTITNDVPGWLKEEEEDNYGFPLEQMIFDSYKEAEKYISAFDNATYYLSNGEVGRPELIICEA